MSHKDFKKLLWCHIVSQTQETLVNKGMECNMLCVLACRNKRLEDERLELRFIRREGGVWGLDKTLDTGSE